MSNKTNYFPSDPITDIQPTTDSAHYEIHEGELWELCDIVTGLGQSASAGWVLITSTLTSSVHLAGALNLTRNGTYWFYEGSTLASAGTTLTAYNHKRDVATSPSLQVQRVAIGTNITTTGYGTQIVCGVIGTDGANPVGGGGGSIQRGSEFILKPNEKYFLRVEAETATARAGVNFEWYEE